MQIFPYLGDDDEYVDVGLAYESYALRNLHKYGREFCLNSCPDIIHVYLQVSQLACTGSKPYWAIVFGGPPKNLNAVYCSILPGTIRRLRNAAPAAMTLAHHIIHSAVLIR